MTNIYIDKQALVNDLIKSHHEVLDIGFYGQGQSDPTSENWLHGTILQKCKTLHGLDLNLYTPVINDSKTHYYQGSAEQFNIPIKVDVVFAGDLIEHLTNVRGFLDSSRKHLTTDGKLILTTPNAFCFYSIIFKIFFNEPGVNKDHTCYFNISTLTILLKKCGWEVCEFGYIKTLHLNTNTTFKLKIIDKLNSLITYFLPKFNETFYVITKPN